MAVYRNKHIRKSDLQAMIMLRDETDSTKKERKYRRKRPTLQKYCEKKEKYAHLLNEWDYAKNGELTPQNITAHSGKKVWWKCSKGHSWQTYVEHRTRENSSNCPYCAGIIPIIGKTDLASLRPDLAAEWDMEKNTITPKDITLHSRKKIWWKCQKGHNWQAVINDRTNGSGCPLCRKIPAHPVSKNPILGKEWDYEKNQLDPQMIPVSSLEKVWWICSKGHSWQATVKSRTSGRGCPYCKGRRVMAGETDLATTNPGIAKEWDYDKNQLTPQDVSAGSGKKIWWKCMNGHSWQATVNSRKQGRGCPYCVRENRPQK